MSLDVHYAAHDEVIRSAVAVGQADYEYALNNLLPLIGRFDEQRKKQNAKFYQRLKEDIVAGCVMPPLTLAFVSREMATSKDISKLKKYIEDNIAKGYILDGMQRLNTLQAAAREKGFDKSRPIYLTVIFAEKYDFLLYRMITLNNGQKPMTPRHQIEILAQNLLDFTSLKNITIQTEKDTEKSLVHGAFKLGDVAAAYTAYLTDNPNNQNNKIIDEKMNEILVGRVMSSDLVSAKAEFSQILELVDEFSQNKEARRWLKLQNNLIGFTLGAKASYADIAALDEDGFASQVEKFEAAFDVINPSKVNVGRYRRELAQEFFSKFEEMSGLSDEEVAERFVDLTTSE
jgi:hypothetical protein